MLKVLNVDHPKHMFKLIGKNEYSLTLIKLPCLDLCIIDYAFHRENILISKSNFTRFSNHYIKNRFGFTRKYNIAMSSQQLTKDSSKALQCSKHKIAAF